MWLRTLPSELLRPAPPLPSSDAMIERYLQSGRSAAMDRTRILLAKHRAGHLIPLQLRIRDLPPGEAGNVGASAAGATSTKGFTLLALMRALDEAGPPPEAGAAPSEAEERVIVDAAGAVRAGTLGALALLRASASELAGVSVFVSDIIHDWPGARAAAAATENGAVVDLVVSLLFAGMRGRISDLFCGYHRSLSVPYRRLMRLLMRPPSSPPQIH